MAHGMIYDMYIWHTKSLKATGIYASCNIPTSLSRSLFVGWIRIYILEVLFLSRIRELLKKPVLPYKNSAPSMHLYYSCLLVTQIWTQKNQGTSWIFLQNVGFSRWYVSCFSILPMMSWCQETRLALQGSTDSTFGRCPTAPRSRSKQAWRSWGSQGHEMLPEVEGLIVLLSRGWIHIPPKGKRKIIDSKVPFLMGYVSSLKGNLLFSFWG